MGNFVPQDVQRNGLMIISVTGTVYYPNVNTMVAIAILKENFTVNLSLNSTANGTVDMTMTSTGNGTVDMTMTSTENGNPNSTTETSTASETTSSMTVTTQQLAQNPKAQQASSA